MYIHIYIYICMYVSIQMYINIHTYVQVYYEAKARKLKEQADVNRGGESYICVYICMYIFIFMYTYVYACRFFVFRYKYMIIDIMHWFFIYLHHWHIHVGDLHDGYEDQNFDDKLL
jgi:hypothetical protein